MGKGRRLKREEVVKPSWGFKTLVEEALGGGDGRLSKWQ